MVGSSNPSWQSFYAGKRVFVTGHTGFKGSWLALRLHGLGASVSGYALDPPTQPALFEAARIKTLLSKDFRADVGDLNALQTAIQQTDPEIIFHLAAKPIVRESYANPIVTIATNVMGTAHLLEAARSAPSLQAVVVITSDKVYENREWAYPYRESDALGGRDPYSASKAAAEIIASSYRESFFSGDNGHPARIATARAGNVIGGGDWASDRLIPDCVRAFARTEPVLLRFPHAVRPWQHVLEPLGGYMQLGAKLCSADGSRCLRTWNFGPDTSGNGTVGDVARTAAHHWGEGARVDFAPPAPHPHEAGLLRLDSTLAHTQLGWRPRWDFSESLAQTMSWYKAFYAGKDMLDFSFEQIAAWEAAEQKASGREAVAAAL